MGLLNTTFIGFVVGILGTGAGGLLTLLLNHPSNRLLSSILGFSGGIMVAIVCFDLVPEAMEMGGIYIGLTGLIFGSLLIALLDFVAPHAHFLENNDRSRFIRSGLLLGIGIAMHNLPEGLAIGSGYAHSTGLGLGLALVIALHNIPEGVAMATPMLIGGVAPAKIIAATILAGLPMGIGAFMGSALGSLSPAVLSFSLGFAGGAMLYISFDELIPNAQGMAEGHTSTYGCVVGVILGILISSST